MSANTPIQPHRELAARAICKVRKLPENVTFDGAPLWQRFLPEADAVLEAIGWASFAPPEDQDDISAEA